MLAVLAALVALPSYLPVEAQRQQDNRALRMQEVKGHPAKAKRFALVIGVDEYQDEQISRLSGATNDAKALADALVRYAGFPSDQVIPLASDQPRPWQPNRGNILQYLSNLRGIVPEDGLLVVSFAGHGIERGGRGFLCPSDARIGGSMALLEATGVAVDTVREWIRETGVKQVLIILDACRNDPSGRGREENRLTDSFAQRFNFDIRNRDMHGNIWEWCMDHWHDNYNGAPSDGRSWEGGDTRYRVLRGGSWLNTVPYCRSANRNRNTPDNRYDFLFGFRVVAAPRTP